jgi:uncharacterized membrane protein (UPF0127 family)
VSDEPWQQRLAGLPTRLDEGVQIHLAATFRARCRGLARMTPLPADHALLISPCRSVHTFGMRFALDLARLDRDGKVVRVDRAVPPNRVKTCLRARAVLESAAG